MRRVFAHRAGFLHRFPPTGLLLLSFGLTIVVGTVVLMLPGSSAGAPLGIVDALFTATSAVCLTGLTVVDTRSSFTMQGQAAILGLIQLGGLGIMNFAIVQMLAAGRHLSVREGVLVRDTYLPRPSPDFLFLAKRLVLGTCVIEGAGALLLWLFTPGAGWFPALFHAVSAFCNAGFALEPESMVSYGHHAGVILTLGALVVLGGLGFFTLLELSRRLRRKSGPRVSLHTRLVLGVTAALVVGGAVSFYIFESRNALRGESAGRAILISLFQSITARTAGFYSLELTRLTNATLFMLILLMFVGASPGSTGGGIKTSTLGVLVGMARSRIRGDDGVHLFYRTLPDATVSRALSVLVLAFSMVTFAVLALAFVEIGSEPYTSSDKRFVEIFFEVASAFGNVGLSTGITPRLSDLGKLILVLVMFVGRVGPLTVAAAVGRVEHRGRFRYAEENVMVG